MKRLLFTHPLATFVKNKKETDKITCEHASYRSLLLFFVNSNTNLNLHNML